MWPRRRHARRGVGRTIGRPYAPTAGATSDDDDSPFTRRSRARYAFLTQDEGDDIHIWNSWSYEVPDQPRSFQRCHPLTRIALYLLLFNLSLQGRTIGGY